MIRYIIICFCVVNFVCAQTKTPAKGGKKPVNKQQNDGPGYPLINPGDTIDGDELLILEAQKFAVYNKRPKTGADRSMKLCINLVHDTLSINRCFNDSLTRSPEVSKVIFEQVSGDTNYVLVLIDAFSKSQDEPGCASGKETKLFFVKWNLKKNRATWKSKMVSSCLRGVTMMNKVNIKDWDKSEPLRIEYHRGSTFHEVMFDPQNYKAGLQVPKEEEKSAD